MAKSELFTGKDGKHYFNLKAANGQVIEVSQGYSNESGCVKGMKSVMKNAEVGVANQTYNLEMLTGRPTSPPSSVTNNIIYPN